MPSSIPLQPKATDDNEKRPSPHIVYNLNTRTPEIDIADVPFEALAATTTIATDLQKPSDVAKTQAKRFVDALEMGFPPNEAVGKAAGRYMPVSEFLGTKNYKTLISELIQSRSVPDEVRKLMVKAGLNDVMMRNLGVDDKLAMDAMKQIAQDPDVGLDRGSSVGVTINIGELASLMDNAMDGTNIPKDILSDD